MRGKYFISLKVLVLLIKFLVRFMMKILRLSMLSLFEIILLIILKIPPIH